MAGEKQRRVRRVERDQDGWIARRRDGDEIETGFRWRTRSGAWHAVWDYDALAVQSPTPTLKREGQP